MFFVIIIIKIGEGIMATLNIIIGIPGSGKSNYAKRYLFTDNSVYLSSDDIRIEL